MLLKSFVAHVALATLLGEALLDFKIEVFFMKVHLLSIHIQKEFKWGRRRHESNNDRICKMDHIN